LYHDYDSELYRIIIQFNPIIGEFRVYHKDKLNGTLTYDVFEKGSIVFLPTRRTNNPFSIMEDIKELVAENALFLANEFEVEIVEIEASGGFFLSDESTPFSAVTNQRVINYLTGRGHIPRSFRNISQLTQNGLTSRLYEQTTFRHPVSILQIVVRRSFTKASVAHLLGNPVKSVAWFFVFVGGVIAYDTLAHIHYVNVTHHRQARVNGIQMYNQYRDLQYRIILAPLNDAGERRWESIDPNFNNPTRMMQNAIAWFR